MLVRWRLVVPTTGEEEVLELATVRLLAALAGWVGRCLHASSAGVKEKPRGGNRNDEAGSEEQGGRWAAMALAVVRPGVESKANPNHVRRLSQPSWLTIQQGRSKTVVMLRVCVCVAVE